MRRSSARHREMLVFCMVAVGLSFILTGGSDGKIHLPGHTNALAPGGLPPLCPSEAFLGSRCPGCGMTRAFVAMADLRIVDAWRHNWGGPFLFILALLQIPYRIYLLRSRRPRAIALSPRLQWIGYGVILLMFAGWFRGLVAN